MIQINQLKLPVNHSKQDIINKIANILHVSKEDILQVIYIRQSIDARKKPDLFLIYTVEVLVNKENQVFKIAKKRDKLGQLSISQRVEYVFPKQRNYQSDVKPVIVGAGPAGLFCGYVLARAGLRPIILERGQSVKQRVETVKTFWESGKLSPNSNVQFGEGGAGTFSDGKLNTLVKDKDGRNRAVLETFVRFGAKESIVYDAKPHIGTDVLCDVVTNMRKEIENLGGIVLFDSQVTDFILEPLNDNEKCNNRKVVGIEINHEKKIMTNFVVLAIGHSARDTFEILYDKGLEMHQKPFAVGFRVEHPQTMINESQYGKVSVDALGAAPYKVTAKTTSGRGVYSFCMCPGGYVVNASSEEGRLAVNGMSYSGRNGNNANSAIIIGVGPDDFPSQHPLAGMEFQRNLEEAAFRAGNGKIPVQRYGDFKHEVLQQDANCQENNPIQTLDLEPNMKGQYNWADLTGILPNECNQAFVEGMEQFGRQIKGYNHPDAILSGVESRTSSPIKMPRDDKYQCNITGLYPCGEGAGYAGGITSAAMDGMRVAEAIIEACTIDES